jgi:hypothetical protein
MPRLDGRLVVFRGVGQLLGLLLTFGLVVGHDATTDARPLRRIFRIHALLTGVAHANLPAHSSPVDSPACEPDPIAEPDMAPHSVRA